MWNFLKDYHTYTKGERKGVIVLIFLLFLLIIFPEILPDFIKDDPAEFEKFKAEIQEFEKRLDSAQSAGQNLLAEDEPFFEEEYELFEFDPNNLPWEKWQELGVKDRTIRVIKNYESKGGRFYEKSDVKKIYGLSEADYERLEPYIVIQDKRELGQKKEAPEWTKEKETTESSIVKPERHYEKPDEELIIELNTADSIVLQKLRGIGPVLSKRIVAYRDKLGGFINKEQLLEVYGIDSAAYLSLAQNFLVDSSAVNKLNVNLLSREELSKHPYINYTTANAIYSYRAQHGSFKDLTQLKKIYLINEELYQKISPYLDVK